MTASAEQAAGFPKEMKEYRPRYVAFIDILGWKEIVDRIGDEPRRLASILDVYAALETYKAIDEFARAVQGQLGSMPPPQHLVMSDTIILIAEDSPEALFMLVQSCGKIGADLLYRGFLTRGSIVRGRLYHNGNVVFGEALTEAYLREQKSARYPRILISRQAHGALVQHGPLQGPWADATYGVWFREDQDGFLRLNLFADLFRPVPELTHAFFAMTARTIERVLDEHSPESEEFAKGHWLAHAYNVEFERISKSNPEAVVGLEPINLAANRQRSK